MNNVDTTQKPVTCVEWFFGYGGNHLGLKRAIPNLRLVAACEIEAYACANVVAKMETGLLDAAPVWTNCKTFPLEMFRGLVDIFIASYPCQGFSSAGKRQGQKDPRFLWPWVLRAIATIQPRYCFFENVDAHVSLGLSTVLSDLEEAGYRHEEGIYSAAECGAPQQRKRVFILAERKLANPGLGTVCAKLRLEQKERAEELSGSFELVDSERQQLQRWRNAGIVQCAEAAQRAEACERERNGHAASNSGEAILENSRSVGLRSGRAPKPGFEGGAALTNIPSEEAVDNAASSRRDTARERSEAVQQSGQRLPPSGRSEQLADSSGIGEREPHNQERTNSRQRSRQNTGRRSNAIFWPEFVARPGQVQHAWEPPRILQTFCGLGGGVNGRAANVDRLRLLGNGVYPAAAERAFRTLYSKLSQ